jgi:hypothetical protein
MFYRRSHLGSAGADIIIVVSAHSPVPEGL